MEHNILCVNKLRLFPWNRFNFLPNIVLIDQENYSQMGVDDFQALRIPTFTLKQ